MLVPSSLVLADEVGGKQDPKVSNPDPNPKLTLILN